MKSGEKTAVCSGSVLCHHDCLHADSNAPLIQNYNLCVHFSNKSIMQTAARGWKLEKVKVELTYQQISTSSSSARVNSWKIII